MENYNGSSEDSRNDKFSKNNILFYAISIIFITLIYIFFSKIRNRREYFTPKNFNSLVELRSQLHLIIEQLKDPLKIHDVIIEYADLSILLSKLYVSLHRFDCIAEDSDIILVDRQNTEHLQTFLYEIIKDLAIKNKKTISNYYLKQYLAGLEETLEILDMAVKNFNKLI